MAFSSLFSPNFTPISSTSPTVKQPIAFHPYLPSSSLQYTWNKKREFSLPSVASIPYQPVNIDYLEEEFSGHGVTFERLSASCIAKMRLENGSIATLMLPSGLITSYKARMWHGGVVELLQTSVLEDEDGSAVIRGGVYPTFNFGCDGENSWSPSTWALRNIKGNSCGSIEVEMVGTDAKDMVEVTYNLCLREDTLISELVVSNSKSSPIQMMGCMISHLTVSTPEATFAYGLQGSDFFTRPVLLSSFSIVPPDLSGNSRFGFSHLWGNTGFGGIFPGWGARNQENDDKAENKQIEMGEMEGEENDNYKNLTEEMSRIYTSAPREFTVIDRGRRNSVIVRREGFDELYMFSPGSSHDSYGKYSFVCVGQSAMLKPVTLNPGSIWTGGQHLHNPSL